MQSTWTAQRWPPKPSPSTRSTGPLSNVGTAVVACGQGMLPANLPMPPARLPPHRKARAAAHGWLWTPACRRHRPGMLPAIPNSRTHYPGPCRHRRRLHGVPAARGVDHLRPRAGGASGPCALVGQALAPGQVLLLPLRCCACASGCGSRTSACQPCRCARQGRPRPCSQSGVECVGSEHCSQSSGSGGAVCCALTLPRRAGTENSPTGPGFYEGAVYTGEEAAKTVGGLLRREKRAR